MYYNRLAERLLGEYISQFRVVGVMGPRQSGKSTLVKQLLGDRYVYVNFDNIELRNLYYTDPVAFMRKYNQHVIFDEVQQMPDIFQRIKEIVDNNPEERGQFVLTGSGQFLLSKNISESLAGRIGLISLLPMQYKEGPKSLQETFVINGGFPELLSGSFKQTHNFFNAYVNTYVQKDLRQMLNIVDINAFTLMLKLLAARVGQQLNLSDIAKETGITVSTLSKWVSVLEASFIIFLLKPFYANIGKRLVKTPKVYFYDNGLLAFLTGIKTMEQWQDGVLYGALFENLIISETLKNIYHNGDTANLWYLRTSHGDEIDLIVEDGQKVSCVEIKASVTYKPVFHKTIEKLSLPFIEKNIVYQGDTQEVITGVTAKNYKEYLDF
ncbi:MAG TPA: ATP-binding protein [Bacteroidales bacterium]|nr:ATP-binding protein [Bacteroidales bacterium]